MSGPRPDGDSANARPAEESSARVGAGEEARSGAVSRRRFLADAGAGAGAVAALALLGSAGPSSARAAVAGPQALDVGPSGSAGGGGSVSGQRPATTDPGAAQLRILAAPTVQAPPLPAAPGARADVNGWIFLHVEGDPHSRGYQHGRLVAPELATIQRTLRHVIPLDTGQPWSYFIKAAEKLYVPRREDEFIAEIRGIAEGARDAGTDITWQEVLAWNAEMELTGYWYPGILSGAYTTGLDKGHCSAFVATGSYTHDGRPVIAHNDWDHYVTGQFARVILDIKPSSGHRILMQAFPGYIASMTDYFVTSAGIMGTETTIGSFSGYDPKKTAEFYRMRKAAQYADTLDEWIRLVRTGNNGGYANSWLLADATTGEIARFELGLKYQGLRRTKDGYFIGFNSAYDDRIRNLECGGDPTFYDTRTPMGCRKVRLAQLLEGQKGRLDAELAKSILSDHYDVYLAKADNPCSRTIEAHYELDAFEYWSARRPYSPQGALDGKVMDAAMAERMSFAARWGSSSGMAFDADAWTAAHPQWDNVAGWLDDRPTQPWTLFTSPSA